MKGWVLGSILFVSFALFFILLAVTLFFVISTDYQKKDAGHWVNKGRQTVQSCQFGTILGAKINEHFYHINTLIWL